MRTLAIVTAVAVAGCDSIFSVDPPHGVSVDAPADMSIVDAQPAGDRDEDGVDDDVDNCPTMTNADQHDEDTDGIGDSCDRCPQLAVADGDFDGDGVGDGCDPEPTNPSEQWLLFDAFDLPRSYACGTDVYLGWGCAYPQTGSVTVVDDAMHLPGSAQFVVEDCSNPQLVRQIVTTARLTATENTDDFIYILGRSTANGTTTYESNYISCGVRRNVFENRTDVTLNHTKNGATLAHTQLPLSVWPPPQRVELRFEIPRDPADETARCSVRWEGGSQTARIDLPLPDRPATYGVWVYLLAAAVDHLAVMVTRPGIAR